MPQPSLKLVLCFLLFVACLDMLQRSCPHRLLSPLPSCSQRLFHSPQNLWRTSQCQRYGLAQNALLKVQDFSACANLAVVTRRLFVSLQYWIELTCTAISAVPSEGEDSRGKVIPHLTSKIGFFPHSHAPYQHLRITRKTSKCSSSHAFVPF